MVYTDKDNLLADYLPDATKPAEKDAIGRILENVSAFVDSYCRRTPGYFLPAETDEDDPTVGLNVKRIRGEGESFLRLPVHVFGSITQIDNEDESQFSTYLYESEKSGWLYFESEEFGNENSFSTGYSCRRFTNGRVYKVTARWGYAETPKDMQEAVKLIVTNIWETAHGTLGQVSAEGFALKPNLLPPDALLILDRYKRREFEI